jgi:hypothetical protein
MKRRLWNVRYAFGDEEQNEVLIVECAKADTAHKLALRVARLKRGRGDSRAARIVGVEDAGTVDARSR